MSTTTIRIPDELKARVTAVAEQAGVTTHSFILQAIAEKTQQEELRRDNCDGRDGLLERDARLFGKLRSG